MGEVSVKNSIFGVVVSAFTVLAVPALAADTPNAGDPGHVAGSGKPEAGSSSSSKKGYDYYKAQSDMNSASNSSRAPAGVTHEYHRTAGACSGEGGDADCDGKADHHSAPLAPEGDSKSPIR